MIINNATTNWIQIYTYDHYGNRLSVTATGVTQDNQPVPQDGISGLTFDAQTNRINVPPDNNGNAYEYDLAGNLVKGKDASGEWQKYEYDTAGRLQRVWNDNKTFLQQDNAYGASRQRETTWSHASGEITYFVTDAEGVISEYVGLFTNQSLEWRKSYVYAGDSLLSTYTNNGAGGETLEFHHPDRLGTRLVTNNQSNNSFEQATLPFGTALNGESSGTSTTTRKFTSYERSTDAKLDYAVNRSYIYALGRFTTVDPNRMSAASLANPQMLNLFFGIYY